MKRIALVSGFWGQNIGNAFFNIGGKWILDQVFPEANVQFVLDQPGYRTFNNQAKGNPRKDWGLLKRLDVDAIVLQGPILTENFPKLWEETFAALTDRGVKIIMLGAAMFRFNQAEREINRAFLSKYKPWILSTRDQPTYDEFKDCAVHAHSGIDSAFFAPKSYQPFRLETPPYVAMNFDRWHEPQIEITSGKVRSGSKDFEWDDQTWQLDFPKRLMRWSDKNKWWSYFAAGTDWRKLPDRLGDYQVVRPEHRFNPHITWKVYKRPNAVASDEPWTYFTIYANASLTVSDRVHACIATLAYGKPAIMFSPSPRSQVFDRLGLSAIREKVVTLDQDYLESQRQGVLDFLNTAIAQA